MFRYWNADDGISFVGDEHARPGRNLIVSQSYLPRASEDWRRCPSKLQTGRPMGLVGKLGCYVTNRSPRWGWWGCWRRGFYKQDAPMGLVGIFGLECYKQVAPMGLVGMLGLRLLQTGRPDGAGGNCLRWLATNRLLLRSKAVFLMRCLQGEFEGLMIWGNLVFSIIVL